jgi:RNA polymerase subunit RPABC4/transcription elongation factor Spt4
MKKKECPSCAMVVDKNFAICPVCAYEFPQSRTNTMIVAILMIILFILYLFF